MAAKRPADKLRKVEAVMADRAATDGEKAAAEAAASRIRMEWKRKHAEEARSAIERGGMMYLLGRALKRAGNSAKPTEKGVMHALGRAWRKAISKS